MVVFSPFWVIVAATAAALALPVAIRDKAWKPFLIAAALSVAGILVPLFVFLASAFLVPEWKGGCDHGWLDCFHLGKLALTPIVLWALGALYALDVYKVKNRTHPLIVLGFFLGAIVSAYCFLYGFLTYGTSRDEGRLFLLVPLYVAVWYLYRAVELIRSADIKPLSYLLALCGSLPLWALSYIWSRQIYLDLPETPPECFVATAAARGHRSFVGPFAEVRRGERTREANRQLVILWQLEDLWRGRAPGSHRAFRRAYNLVGPLVARRITTPLAADLAYAALKPLETLAAVIISLDRPGPGPHQS